jgi:hypothetical protein
MRRKKIVLVLLALLGVMSMSGCCVDSYWLSVGFTDFVAVGARGFDGCDSPGRGPSCGGGGSFHHGHGCR